jgi:cyclomaltodextrin glucanotransferase
MTRLGIFLPALLLLFLALSPLSAHCAGRGGFYGGTIYFIVTDRFQDGDPANNPDGEIFSPDRSQWKLYWGGDVQGVIDRLSYIRSLGCTAIWLTPVVENTGDLYRYGKNGEEKISAYHGYWAMDWFRMNPHAGSMEKYRELVQKAHQQGIKVVFDMVLNHTSPGGQGIDGAIFRDGRFVASLAKDPAGWFHHLGGIDFTKEDPAEWQDKNLFDLADLASENPLVAEYLEDAGKMWMDAGIDAFRLDTVRHVPVEFAARFAKGMKEKNPGIFIFGEWSMGGANVPGAVSFSRKTGISLIDFSFTYILTDVLCRDKPFHKMDWLIRHDTLLPDPCSLVTCIDNHDMPRFISTAIGEGKSWKKAALRTEMAVYIMMTSRGIPCIYYGTEQLLHEGRQSSWGFGGEPYNRQAMTGWKDRGRLFKNIKALADLRREMPALWGGGQETLLVTDDLWVFQRRMPGGGSVVVTAANKGPRRWVSLEGTALPDGLYDNSRFSHHRVMGPPIRVEKGKATFQLGEDQVGIWCFRTP